jgi:hypothetical protein
MERNISDDVVDRMLWLYEDTDATADPGATEVVRARARMRRSLEAVWPEPMFTDEELAAVEIALYDRRETLAHIDHRHFRLPAVCSAHVKVKSERANGS